MERNQYEAAHTDTHPDATAMVRSQSPCSSFSNSSSNIRCRSVGLLHMKKTSQMHCARQLDAKLCCVKTGRNNLRGDADIEMYVLVSIEGRISRPYTWNKLKWVTYRKWPLFSLIGKRQLIYDALGIRIMFSSRFTFSLQNNLLTRLCALLNLRI